MKKKNILCLFSDIGGAHVTIAGIFREKLGEHFGFHAVDLFRETSGFCSGSIRLYSRVLRDFPGFYNLFYEFNNRRIFWNLTYRVFIRSLMKEKTKRMLLEREPDAVLSLFALTSRIAADAIGELGVGGKVPLIVFVVDPFTVHASWLEPRADLYLVPGDECKAALVAGGIEEKRIRLIRYPVNRKFGNVHDTGMLRERYGIAGSSRTVMIMGGGDGVVRIDRISHMLLGADGGVHVIAVAGRNRDLYEKLEGIRRGGCGRITVFGFAENVCELMALSDVLITKPGPSTIMEAIESGLPLILTGCVPRQEEGNIDYVVSNNLGVHIRHGDISRACDYIFDDSWSGRVRSSMEAARKSFPATDGLEEIRELLD